MVDRTFSFDDTNTPALKIQLNEVREELRQRSSKLDENDLPSSFIALLNYETELSDTIKGLEDSKSSHLDNNSNVYKTKNFEIGKSQVEQDYEMAILLSEQMQLEDAHFRTSKSTIENIDSNFSLGFSHRNVSEEIGRSMETWRFSNLNTPARLNDDHRSKDVSAKHSQVQFDYEMAVRLSEEMQLEDARLRSSRGDVEKFHDVTSSNTNYGEGADIKNVEQSKRNWSFSSINNLEEDSRGNISRNPSNRKSQVQRDYEMALELSGELQQKGPSLKHSGKLLDNFTDIAPSSTKHGPQGECTGCRDLFSQGELISVGCPKGHVYCKDCLKNMFRLSISKEVPFPPRCCENPIAFPLVAKHFTPNEAKQFLDAELEHQTKDKVYCSRPECGQFIPRKGSDGNKATCPRCRHLTCVKCKKAAHRGDCAADEDMQKLKALAVQNNWVRCFQCQSIVDRVEGCNHMTCICGAQFCYKCSRRWKTCSCEEFQFDLIQSLHVQNFHHPPVQNFQHPPVQNFQHPHVQNFQHPPIQNFQHPPIQNFQHPPIQNFQHRPVHYLQSHHNPHNFHNFQHNHNHNPQNPQNLYDQDFFENWNMNNFHRF